MDHLLELSQMGQMQLVRLQLVLIQHQMIYRLPVRIECFIPCRNGMKLINSQSVQSVNNTNNLYRWCFNYLFNKMQWGHMKQKDVGFPAWIKNELLLVIIECLIDYLCQSWLLYCLFHFPTKTLNCFLPTFWPLPLCLNNTTLYTHRP